MASEIYCFIFNLTFFSSWHLNENIFHENLNKLVYSVLFILCYYYYYFYFARVVAYVSAEINTYEIVIDW